MTETELVAALRIVAVNDFSVRKVAGLAVVKPVAVIVMLYDVSAASPETVRLLPENDLFAFETVTPFATTVYELPLAGRLTAPARLSANIAEDAVTVDAVAVSVDVVACVLVPFAYPETVTVNV